MDTTRLEAIMFTDIAGYSRLMDEDEDRTISLLRRHNEIVLPILEEQSGQVIDAIGDGLLVVFPSVRKATESAVAIHEAIEVHNMASDADQRFKLRVGIHLGEVRHEEGRVFGSGVNVAARVQPFALPGGICITEDVFRHVERRIPQEMVSIGVHKLRNISREYELYRVITGYEELNAAEGSATEGAAGSAGNALPARPSGELDEVKEKILTEIGKWSERSRERDPESREARIESKVYSVVERVMDKALEKWESMPEEKKTDIIHKINVEIDKGGKEKKKEKKEEEDKASSVAGSIAWGAAATAGAAFWYLQVPGAWPIVLGILLGVLPLISGFSKLFKRLIQLRGERATRPIRLEREVLKAASELGGRVTVVQISARTGHPLDEIQTTLDRMTLQGYVSQHILESGIIQYEFPALTDSSDTLR